MMEIADDTTSTLTASKTSSSTKTAERSTTSTVISDELTNISSTCSSSVVSNLSFTQASSERESEDYYADVGFMFEGLQPSTLKRFTWGRQDSSQEDTTETLPQQVRVALHVVEPDEPPGALQSGHRLWPAAPALAEYLMEQAMMAQQQQLACLRQPRNILELGAGSALLSLTALQLLHDSLQCLVVTDHDPGTLERARDNYETTLEDLLESTRTEEEQLDCINGLVSVPILFETHEWGELDSAQEIATAAAEHSSPLLLEEAAQATASTAEGAACNEEPQVPQNPNHNPECNFFDLLLGSDLIYCKEVVQPLFESVSYFMTPGGSFLLSQSFLYDEAAEACIDEVCQALNLQRTILKDTLKEEKQEGGVRIQQFAWRSTSKSESHSEDASAEKH